MLVQLLHADPLVIAISLVALLVFVVAPLGRWTLLGRREGSGLLVEAPSTGRDR